MRQATPLGKTSGVAIYAALETCCFPPVSNWFDTMNLSECVAPYGNRHVAIYAFPALNLFMASDFRTALDWHRGRFPVSLTKLARESGMSLDALKKINNGSNSSTSVENAMLVASYFGKNVNQFFDCEDVGVDQEIENLFSLLKPEDRRTLTAQIRGLISARAAE